MKVIEDISKFAPSQKITEVVFMFYYRCKQEGGEEIELRTLEHCVELAHFKLRRCVERICHFSGMLVRW